MNRLFLLSLFIFFVTPSESKTIQLTNGTILSITETQIQTHQNLLFDDETGLIIEDTPQNRKQATVIDLAGKTVLPGLIDAHGHVLEYGLGRIQVELRNIESRQKTIEAVKLFAELNPNAQWIIGRGWNQELWQNNDFPNRYDLDQLNDSRPMWLARVDGHAGWANSAALKLAGINESTARDNDLILKDADGRPTGILIDNAMTAIAEVLPSPSKEEKQKALVTAFSDLAAVGITAVHDAGIGSENYEMYLQMASQKQLPIRIYAMLDGSGDELPQLLDKGKININDHFIVQSVKMMIDGALGSYGALMHQPYSDKRDASGAYVMDKPLIESRLKQTVEAGFQANIHAIGDKGNTQVVDLLSQPWANANELRHRLEHAQILRLEDIFRMQQSNIIASMQPTHATSDMNMAETRVGAARIKGGYAWKTILNSGVKIASGSDFPVEHINPFFGIHAAVMRQNHTNQPNGGWYSNEAMTLEQALRSFTIDAAYAAHMEQKTGSLEAGKYADFIIINEDLLSMEQSEIWTIKVLETWVNGSKIFTAQPQP